MTVDAAEADDILEGRLTCTECGAIYPIAAGIPRMLHLESGWRAAASENTSRHFELEFSAFAEADRDMDPVDLRQYLFYSRTGLDRTATARVEDPYPTSSPSELHDHSFDVTHIEGRIVLDAGTGPGRFLDVVSAAGAQRVVGLELGDHVLRARSRTRHLENVAVVQGSVLAPPFRASSFDLVYSIGVLHHTLDPAGGVIALASLLAPEGRLAVWVYPPEYWGGRLRGNTGRIIHRVLTRLPNHWAYRFCRRVLYPLGRLQMKLAAHRWTKLLFAPLFLVGVPRHPRPEVMMATIMDYFAAPTISTHEPVEVASWFDAAGLTGIETLPVRTSVSGLAPAADFQPGA